MKNKKGFISISVVYSFFLIFLLILVLIVDQFVSNRRLLYNFKEQVKEEINGTSTTGTKLNDFIKSKYTGEDGGTNGIYLHDGFGTSGDLEAGDYSYRYSGANPSNYICFGTDEATCPDDNKYRIIGVFDNKVKLIKATSAKANLLGTTGGYKSDNSFYYHTSQFSNWMTSALNIVNLNSTYLNSFAYKWQDLIAITKWQIGGNSSTNILGATPKECYNNELIEPAISNGYTAKIALLYASDYAYGATPNNWDKKLQEYSLAKASNWLVPTTDEWLLTKSTDLSATIYTINNAGNVASTTLNTNVAYQVRPVFYLKNTVKVKTNNASNYGTINNPYRIEVGS